MAERKIDLLGVALTIHPSVAVPGLVVAALTALIANKRPDKATLAVGSGLLWYIGDILHTLGHVVSARAAHAPMDRIDVGFYPKTVYFNNDVSPQQHIGRANGGVLASLSAALVCGTAARLLHGRPAGKFVMVAAIQQALFVLGSLLPLPVVDGGVILANTRKLRA